MQDELRKEFEQRFERPPELGARAPGRVNLIGEHTDYSEGLVLPCAIDRDTVVLSAPREDGRVRAFSLGLESGIEEFDAAAPRRRGRWIDYVQGILFALAERGVAAPGLDLGIASRVPRESGLSSSAALGVAVTRVLATALGLELPAEEIARLAHRGESGFVGVACGIMDQFASALGRRDHALRIDCRSQAVTPVRLGGHFRLLVAQSGVRRSLAAGAYGERVAECAAAFEAARRADVAGPGARTLRDLEPADLPALEGALDPLLLRRARHVVTENARVDAFCDAVRGEDPAAAGAILREGMRSLRDDFEVSVPELDALCEIGDAQPGVFGSRLTGAGFGGATLHLVRPDAVAEAGEALQRGFEARFGRRPEVLAAETADGVAALDV